MSILFNATLPKANFVICKICLLLSYKVHYMYSLILKIIIFTFQLQLMGDVSFCMSLKMPFTAGIALSGIFVHSCKSFSEYSRTFVVGKETRLFYLIFQVPEIGLVS